MEGYYVFVGKDGTEHTAGHLEYHFFEDHGNGAIEHLAEPSLENFEEIKAVLEFIRDQFPHGWKIENGKVVGLPAPDLSSIKLANTDPEFPPKKG